MKICGKCKIKKEESEFSKDKGRKDGLQSICKQCEKAYNAQRYEANKDYYTQKNKQWYEANKDHRIQRAKQWREANKDRCHQRAKQWREANKDHCARHAKQKSATIRGLGFKPINNYFISSVSHHLLWENSKDFIIYLPFWDHVHHTHNPKNPETMTTINAIALDFWINELLYHELFKP